MALSGSYYTNVGTHWRLQLEWSATQNITNNTSYVTAKMYWIALDGYGAVYSSTNKSGSITLDGVSSSFSGSGLAQLKANQKKLIKQYSRTVSHSSDGKGSVNFNGYFDVQATLAGTYFNRVSLGSKTFTLNTIPRASSLTSSKQASWNAGSNTSFGVSRASSGFTHKIIIAVNGTTIKTLSGVGTSASSAFSTTENANIFKQIAQGSSKGTSITLETYSGSTKIGSKSYSGTVTAPSATRAKITNPTGVSVSKGQEQSTVWIDQTVNLDLPRAHSGFTHTVRFKDGNSGAIVHQATGVGSSYSWTPTASEKSTLYSKTPSDIEFDGQIDVYTYYNGVQVRSMLDTDINYRVRNSNPNFGGGMVYADITAVPSGISKTNQQIIQNYSHVKVTIPLSARATAVNGASIESYLITLNGNQQPLAYSSTADVSIDMGIVTAGVDVTLSVRAIDSRGNTVDKSKPVTVIPYKKPAITKTAKRKNNFEADTALNLSGSISAMSIGNALQYVRYRYRAKGGSFTGWYAFSYTTSSSTFKASEKVVTLDNTVSYDIEFYVSDKLGATSEVVSLSSGEPILFIDTKLRSVGVNKFPENSKSFEVNGGILLKDKNWSTLKIESSTAGYDPSIELTSAGGSWSIRNDDSSSNTFDFRWNNQSKAVLYPSGTFKTRGGLQVESSYFEISPYNADYGTSGKAQMFYDANRKRLKLQMRNANNGIDRGSMYMDTLELGSSIYYQDGGAINLNNSDIMGANGIFFRDTSDTAGEGLLFLKSGKPLNSTNINDYDQFRVLDGAGYINEGKVLTSNNTVIEVGYTTVTPKGNNVATSVDVKFRKHFPSSPKIVVSANTSVPGSLVTGVATTGGNTTGFTLWLNRTNTTSTGVHWMAIWEA